MISVIVRAAVRGRVDSGTLRRRAAKVLSAFGEGEADLVLVLTDDAEIQALNLEWRGKDKPTDVLSFSQREGELPPGMDVGGMPLGDVIISLDTAARQVAEDGCLERIWPVLAALSGADPTVAPAWSVADEVGFLMLHGVLHLLGYDHEEAEDAVEMEGLEADLLPWVLGKVRRPPPPRPEADAPA